MYKYPINEYNEKRLDDILYNTVPDIISNDDISSFEREKSVGEIYKEAITILPHQHKYTEQDINRYFNCLRQGKRI